MPQTARSLDKAAIALMLVGGVVPILGIFLWILGASSLWRSTRFHLRDKLIGSLLLPGGLQAAVLYLGANIEMTCHRACAAPIIANTWHTTIFAVLVAVPLGTGCWLWWVWRQSEVA